ncbi:hypothetical protein GCM10009535_36920 [Streptomyces thermocarboxydovorans]|uniref:Uncharacterized protein n=1 Tax=Streptomyces thermocarboxydovorans TaxID=59298 RepID=A0ABN1HJH3_9ACTN
MRRASRGHSHTVPVNSKAAARAVAHSSVSFVRPMAWYLPALSARRPPPLLRHKGGAGLSLACSAALAGGVNLSSRDTVLEGAMSPDARSAPDP